MAINRLTLSILACVLLMRASPCHILAQQPTAFSVSPIPHRSTSSQPVSLPHVYWHFLIYQNHLDLKAKELQSHGKDGRFFRDLFQTKLAWSDADFAPIRESSVRLAAEVSRLDEQAAVIRLGATPTSSSQLETLATQREADINAEITYLKQKLSPEKIKALEAFLVPYFAPKTLSVPPSTNNLTGQTTTKAVQ
jgi:hypothetical protein